MKNKKKLIIVLVLIMMFVFLLVFKNQIYKIIYPKQYEEIISEISDKYEIDQNLIFSVIKVESNFNEQASSNKSAIGLMQILEDTAKDVAVKNNIELDEQNILDELVVPNKNIDIGAAYLANLINIYDNVELALAAYNAGMGTVNNWIEKGIIASDGSDIENIPYEETNYYVRKVLNAYDIYKELYG